MIKDGDFYGDRRTRLFALDEDKDFTKYPYSNAAYEVIYYTTGFHFSQHEKTRDALCYGDIFFTFNTIDSDVDYNNLSYDEVLKYAENSKTKGMSIKFYKYILLKNDYCWTESNSQPGFINNLSRLIESYKNLPEAPQGTTGWKTF